MGTNHVYAVAGAKGGVGKTTTSLNLGASLAAGGYSTVVVELDMAMANLVDFLDLDEDLGSATNMHDVLGGETDVRDAIYSTDTDLTVVPSGTDLGGYVDTDLDRLPEAIETLRWHHDVIILDTPAGLSEETIRPLQLADDALIISTPRVSSIRNAKNTLELAERVDTDVTGLVLTKSGTGASPGADQIAEFLGVELLGHVPEDDAVPHAQDHGTPVVADAPHSGAAVAYRKIAAKLAESHQVTPARETAEASTGESGHPAADDEPETTDDEPETTDDADSESYPTDAGTVEATDGGSTAEVFTRGGEPADVQTAAAETETAASTGAEKGSDRDNNGTETAESDEAQRTDSEHTQAAESEHTATRSTDRSGTGETTETSETAEKSDGSVTGTDDESETPATAAEGSSADDAAGEADENQSLGERVFSLFGR